MAEPGAPGGLGSPGDLISTAPAEPGHVPGHPDGAPAGDRRRDPHADTLPASEPPGDDPAARPLPAQERYRLGAELGRGGMGRVVEAFDLQLGRTVALKEVLPRGGRGTVRRFEREVQLTARLEHPSIVPLYDSGVTADGRPFYVMRKVSGRPFDELIARARGLDERLTLLPPLLAAIDAVAHAHRRGVIHRDLKPQNILVGELGETVVIDWGLAKVIGEADTPSVARALAVDNALRTQVGSVFGTPGFMSPEQARGEELGPGGDVFALGATLYQLLAGTPPLHGNSATDVIDRTARQERVRPLEEVAPGAPRELVAIVEQALAFDPARRYPDAGALGEDVRRFLAGQLVAAHRYTPGQHVARFARRHRAPLGVAALALVAVAALAWIAVARIIAERDAADAARADAVAGRRDAERARDALAERTDALLITQARALLESSPTEAVAALKALSPGSTRLPEARAIAQAAAARGVAWAIEGPPELTVIAELEPGGKRLLQVTRDGMIRIWDLDARRSQLARRYAAESRAMWVSGGRVLVTHPRSSPQLLDPAANTSEPLPIDPITSAVATAAGDRVLFTTAARGARLLDVARRGVTEVDAERQVSALAIAPDGAWLALAAPGDGVVVLDAAGKELTRRRGAAVRLAASPARALAVLTNDGKVSECRLGDAPAWTEVPVPVPAPHRVIDLAYRGEELDLWATTGTLYGWNGARAFERLQLDRIMAGMRVAGGATLVIPGPEGTLRYVTDAVTGTLRLPSAVARMRIAAATDARRIVAVGDGILLGLDLDAVVPRALPQPPGMLAWFVDDRTLLASRGVSPEWSWVDVETGAQTAFSYAAAGIPQVADVDAPTGRVLVREVAGPQQRLLQLRKGSPEVAVIAEGRAVWGRAIAGDAIVYGVGDGRLFARIGAGEPREVAKLDGVAEGAVGLGYRRFAAHSTSGEIVRGDLTTDQLDRARVAVGSEGFVAADSAGRALIAEGQRLLAWDGAITELARFERPITEVEPYEGGVLVHLADREVQAFEPGREPYPVRLLAPGKRPAATSFDGKLLVGPGTGQELQIVELPSRARWTLPPLVEASDLLLVAPTSRRVLQGTDRHFVIWTLPRAGPELGPWLDELTNATLDAGGLLAWPWQRPGAP